MKAWQKLRQQVNTLITKKWRRLREDKLVYEYLKDKRKILDIGCGDGSFMQWFPPGRIMGIDTNESSVKLCREKGLNVIMMDALKIDLEEKFDAVHCSHIIEHFYPYQLHQFLKRIDEMLVPGGLLIIRTPLLWDGFYDDLTHIRPYNPSVLIRYSSVPSKSKFQYDINTHISYLNKFWIGGSYRNKRTFAAMFQVQPNDQLRIAYTYNIELSQLGKYSKGSHEVMLRYIFRYNVDALNPLIF